MNSLNPVRKDFKSVRRANTFRRRVIITSGIDVSSVQSWLMKVKNARGETQLQFATGDGITVQGNALILERTANQMKINAGTYQYDLVMTMYIGDVHTLMEGEFIVSNSVSV